MERLIRGELDFWITADNPDIEGLSRDPLFEEHFFIVIPEKVLTSTVGDKIAQKILSSGPRDFRIEDVIDCPFVLLNPGNRSRDKFDNALRSRKLTPKILLETDNSQTAFALAQKEMALTIYSDMFLRNYAGELNRNVRIIPLDNWMYFMSTTRTRMQKSATKAVSWTIFMMRLPLDRLEQAGILGE